MTETFMLALLGAFGAGATAVWLFVQRTIARLEDKIDKQDKTIDAQQKTIAWQTTNIVKIITAIQYGGDMTNSEPLQQLINDILEELSKKAVTDSTIGN